MRIRGTKPDFWRSERIASVEWEDRLVLKGLESYVDDNGVGKDDIALIVGDLFQRDLVREPSRTLARVSEAISRLENAGLVWRYEANGTPLLFVAFWEQIQRVDKPQPGRFPRPDGTMNYKQSIIRESPKNVRESSRGFAPVLEEQGNRGTEEKEPPYPPNDEPPTTRPSATRPKNGAEVARTNFANLPARSPAAHHIAQAFSDSLPDPIESGTKAEIATQIDKCLRDKIAPPAIADGLRAWAASASWHPSQIPKFVMKAAAAKRPNGVGKPTIKAMGYDQLAEELIAEISREEL